MENTNHKEQLIGVYAGLLTAAEVGVGSLLHAFSLPFTGYILSLNQVLILTKALDDSCEKSKGLTASISSIAAILKSLSPMGKRLTPMLAIAMQGLLYNVGIFIGGNRFMGQALGACLLACWGFAQPILIYYLIFGQVLFNAIFTYIPYSWFWTFLVCVVSFKCVLAVGVVRFSSYIPVRWWARWMPARKKSFPRETIGLMNTLFKSAKDLLMFPFLLSLALTGTFLYASHESADAMVWGLLRPVAIGYIVFFALRMLPASKIGGWLEQRPHLPLSRSFQIALKFISPAN